MTVNSDQTGPVHFKAGQPSWRVVVAAEADWLDGQLNAALECAAERPPDAQAIEPVIRRSIKQARDVAISTAGWRTPLDWWFGTSVEAGWLAVHHAAELLVLIQRPQVLRAMVPHLETLASVAFSPGAALQEKQALVQAPGTPDRMVAQRILGAYHVQSDVHHQRIRELRNLLYGFLTAAVIIDCVLWASGVTAGAVVGLGALAGTVSVAFTVRADTPAGPYNLLPAQSLLKIATGAATAIMAAKILDFASNVPASIARDSVYAIVFGFSQQAFTRLVDQRADALSKGPDARSSRAAGQGPVPNTG